MKHIVVDMLWRFCGESERRKPLTFLKKGVDILAEMWYYNNVERDKSPRQKERGNDYEEAE